MKFSQKISRNTFLSTNGGLYSANSSLFDPAVSIAYIRTLNAYVIFSILHEFLRITFLISAAIHGTRMIVILCNKRVSCMLVSLHVNS
jgi:hypothetical protein